MAEGTGRLKVLVADDEPSTTELVGTMLSYYGYLVSRAYDGPQALALAQCERPDFVLLDVMMPRMSGREVSRALRQDPKLAGVPVVLFSSADEDLVRWRDAGADCFLQKPFDIRALPDLLRTLERPVA